MPAQATAARRGFSPTPARNSAAIRRCLPFPARIGIASPPLLEKCSSGEGGAEEKMDALVQVLSKWCDGSRGRRRMRWMRVQVLKMLMQATWKSVVTSGQSQGGCVALPSSGPITESLDLHITSNPVVERLTHSDL